MAVHTVLITAFIECKALDLLPATSIYWKGSSKV
jgi:hypothetical protein